MDTFGDRLKQEREGRGLTLQVVAETLGVDSHRLRALERNHFEALPDEATTLDCLRSYAECLNVDPELMIEDYVREREACLLQLQEAILPAAAETHLNRPSRIDVWFVRAAILAIIGTLGVLWMRSGNETAPRAQPAPVERQAEVARPLPMQPEEQPVPQAPDLSTLSIPDFGVGTGVENRELVGRSSRFAEETQVWFWTDVNGASTGDRIEHVWLHQGVEVARIPLKLGGPRWRTQSAKTLHPGSVGDWAVEVRDAADRVVTRHEFVCTP